MLYMICRTTGKSHEMFSSHPLVSVHVFYFYAEARDEMPAFQCNEEGGRLLHAKFQPLGVPHHPT